MAPLQFSVIIPTRNRPRQLTGCVDALSRLEYPRDRFELIVVNDGGSPIDDVLQRFSGRLNLTCVSQVNAGPAAARNKGAALSRARYLAFTDDDCRPSSGWLGELERALAKDSEALVGGRVVNVLEENSCSAASQILVTYLYEYFNTNHQRALFFTSNNMALTRDAYQTAGGFDSRFLPAAAEDRDFCDRWTESGRPMIYAENAVVGHAHRLTPRSFLRQHFEYGRGARRFRLAKAHRGSGEVPLEPPGFYAGILRYPWTVRARRPFLLSALLFLSQAANAAGFFRETLQTRG
jgi:GT2 family glycosyltransferase